MQKSLRSLAFIVPFRPLVGYKNADEVLRLLSCTLNSVVQQSDPNWRVVLSASDRLRISVGDARIEQLIPVGALPETASETSIGYSDMHLKRRFAVEQAFNTGASHIMFLDADDLVHKDLTRFVNSGDEDSSYLAETGYELIGKTHRVMLRSSRFAARCGSSAIVSRRDFQTEFFKSTPETGSSPYYHHSYVSYLASRNVALLPSPMVVYRTEHVGNITKGVKDLAKGIDWLKDVPRLARLVGKFAFSQNYGEKFKEQFGGVESPGLKVHHDPCN